MKNKKTAGHSAALLTVLIWGTTFISTKILLADFKPVEILFFRFVIGFLALLAAYPKRLGKTSLRRELIFAAAGLCGICMYYLLENIALTLTSASNVGVIISAAPLFTAVSARILIKSGEKLSARFFAGFIAAMTGIFLISFKGADSRLSPAGDLPALAAALVWALYSLLAEKIGGFGYPVIPSARRIFFYGILFMLPVLFLFDFRLDLYRFADMTLLINILYLGLGASALCFVTWNFAVKELGKVKTSVYIYLVPVITLAASVLILHERLSLGAGAGAALTLAGLFLSEHRSKKKGGRNEIVKQEMRNDN